MPTHPVITVIDEIPTFDKPLSEILSVLKVGGAIKTMTPLEHHTDRQRRWYKGVCLTGLCDWNGDTKGEWDLVLKALCGGGLLNTEDIYLTGGHVYQRMTIVGVGKKNMTEFIENILAKAIEMEWPVTAPDPDLRK